MKGVKLFVANIVIVAILIPNYLVQGAKKGNQLSPLSQVRAEVEKDYTKMEDQSSHSDNDWFSKTANDFAHLSNREKEQAVSFLDRLKGLPTTSKKEKEGSFRLDVNQATRANFRNIQGQLNVERKKSGNAVNRSTSFSRVIVHDSIINRSTKPRRVLELSKHSLRNGVHVYGLPKQKPRNATPLREVNNNNRRRA